MTIAEIENGIITALRDSDLAGICPTIDSYHGEIDDLIKELPAMTTPLPATFVLYAGSTFTESANLSFDEEPTFTVISIAKNLRGRGAAKEGIYEAMEIQKTTLVGQNLGLDIEPLKPQRIDPNLITKVFSVYSFDFKTSFSMD